MGDAALLGAFEELVLLALVHLDRESYGMALRREIARRSGRDVSIGAVYATLSRLEGKGYLETYLHDGGEDRGGQPRRMYRLLPVGADVLARTGEVRGNMWEGVDTAALREGPTS